ncbi:MAG: hypothetical protein ACI4U2_01120 [Christensenellaceae bacterium]
MADMEKKAGKLKVVARDYSGTRWLLDMEYRCFGYKRCGVHRSEVDDGYEATYDEYSNKTTVTHKSHIVKTVYYRRPKVYPVGPIFGLLSLLSGIVSRIRVIALNLIGFVILAFVGLMLLGMGDLGVTVATAATMIYLILIGLTVLLALGGLLVRKLCGYDRRADEIMEQYGYQPWSEYENES